MQLELSLIRLIEILDNQYITVNIIYIVKRMDLVKIVSHVRCSVFYCATVLW